MRKLILDYDAPVDRDELDKRIDFVSDITQIDLRLHTIHPTARGAHVLIYAMSKPGLIARVAAELTPMEVVTLQLLLGSDPDREAFNFQRARILGDAPAFWQERWNVSYSEKL